MNRRNSIKKIALATGFLAILPSWARGWTRDTLAAGESCFTADEQQLLSAVADALIPAGKENVGALSVGVDQFLNRLYSDCYEPEIQDKIKLQLQQIDQKARNDYQTSFESCSTPQKMSIMEQCACNDDPEVRDTFQLLKNETIRGFRTSKVVMTEYLDYQVIPAHFNGCVEVNS